MPSNTTDDFTDNLVADLKSLRRRVRALAGESDSIGMFCHDEFDAIDGKLKREIDRVKREAVYEEEGFDE